MNQEVAMRLLVQALTDGVQVTVAKGEEGPATDDLLGQKKSSGAKPLSEEPAWLSSLTAREKEVLVLLTEGKPNKEIARKLLVNVSTVKNHVRQIISKLGVSDRTQAALLAVKGGMLSEDSGEG